MLNNTKNIKENNEQKDKYNQEDLNSKESKESKEINYDKESCIILKINSDDIKCKVCNEFLVTPKLLPCTHRLCETCLFKIYMTKNPMKCPFCRHSITIDCPTDVFLVNLFENFSIERSCKNIIENSKYEKHVKDCIQCLTHEYDNSRKFDIRNRPKKSTTSQTNSNNNINSMSPVIMSRQNITPNTINDLGIQLVSSVFPELTAGYGI
jgi:hypothetical protein